MDDSEKTQKKQRSLIDWERPRLDDPLYIENNAPHGFANNPNDGLPMPHIDATIDTTEAADLTPDRFVCMEHKSENGSVLRVQCSHYKRQLLPSEDKQHTICLRYCSAIKNESGEMTDLGNSEVLACEFRTPLDPESKKKLDLFDAGIIERQKERIREEQPFDVDAELEKE